MQERTRPANRAGRRSSRNEPMSTPRPEPDELARQIFERYADRLVAVVQARLNPLLRRRVSARDVVQSAFCTFFRRGMHLTPRELDPGAMLYRIAVELFSSTFSFPTFTRPLYSWATESTVGAIMRQGPHHSAQKSTSTGTSEFRTSCSQEASEKFRVFSPAIDFL